MLSLLHCFSLLFPLQKLKNGKFQTGKKSIEIELLINSNSNSWEILLTIAIAIAIVPKMSIAIVISILLISSGMYLTSPVKLIPQHLRQVNAPWLMLSQQQQANRHFTIRFLDSVRGTNLLANLASSILQGQG